MLLGLLAVGALWVIGIGQFFSRSGSGIIAACALIVGAVMIAVGLYQPSLMAGEFHRAIQVIHAVLGLFTVGAGHMARPAMAKTWRRITADSLSASMRVPRTSLLNSTSFVEREKHTSIDDDHASVIDDHKPRRRPRNAVHE
jgi:hypothetical protein